MSEEDRPKNCGEDSGNLNRGVQRNAGVGSSEALPWCVDSVADVRSWLTPQKRQSFGFRLVRRTMIPATRHPHPRKTSSWCQVSTVLETINGGLIDDDYHAVVQIVIIWILIFYLNLVCSRRKIHFSTIWIIAARVPAVANWRPDSFYAEITKKDRRSLFYVGAGR